MVVVYLNRFANHGKALKKWKKVAPMLEGKYLPPNYSLVEGIGDLRNRLHGDETKGPRVFIAAGGDGTVNFLVNEIMKIDPAKRRDLCLGAIGLGSSNDFHKPFPRSAALAGGIPVKTNDREAMAQNVGQVDLKDAAGSRKRRYFIINSSVGIVAQANYLFNLGDPVIRFLKPRWMTGAIWYSGLKTLISFRNIPAGITVGDHSLWTRVTSLNVIINPHVSGNFCYDVDISPFSGVFGVALCYGMKLGAKLRTFLSLARGKFLGLPRTAFWTTQRASVFADRPIPVELDGEITLATEIKMRLLQGELKVCQ